MKTSPPPSKTRSDSTLDARLTPAQADALAERLEHGLSIREATRALAREHSLRVSEMTVSRWAKKRRRAAADARLAAALETLQADRQQAASLREEGPAEGEKPDAARDFARANLLLVSQALFAAVRDGDQEAMGRAARLLAGLEGSATRARRVEVAQFAAETGRKRFEYNAAQNELAHDEKAAREQEESGSQEELVPEHERIQRAIRRTFGPPPSQAEMRLQGEQMLDKRRGAEVLRYRAEAAKLREEADLWDAQAEEKRQEPAFTPPGSEARPAAPAEPPPEPAAPEGPMVKMCGNEPPQPGEPLYWDSKRRVWCDEPPPEESDYPDGVLFPKRYRSVLFGR